MEDFDEIVDLVIEVINEGKVEVENFEVENDGVKIVVENDEGEIDGGDDHGERDVPDFAAAVPGAVRYLHAEVNS